MRIYYIRFRLHVKDFFNGLLNQGAGVFTEAGRAPLTRDLRADGDFDRDGRRDVVIVSDGTLSLLYQRADGSFVQVHYALPLNCSGRGSCTARPVIVFVDDVDDDGWLDVLILHGGDPSGVWVWHNSNIGLAAPVDFVLAGGHRLGSGPVIALAVDLDGNGRIDLAMLINDAGWEHPGGIAVLLSYSFGLVQTTYPLDDNPRGLLAADFDDDGDLDLATGLWSSTLPFSEVITILRNNGDGTFEPSDPVAALKRSTVRAAVDLDGDGDLDLLSSSGVSNDVFLSLNDDAGGFSAAIRLDIPAITNREPVPAAGDLDDDGDVDLVVAFDLAVWVLWNETRPRSTDVNDNGILDECEVPGDFDHDGDADLADYLALLACFGQAGRATGLGCAAADLDGDGDADLSDLIAFQAAFTGSR